MEPTMGGKWLGLLKEIAARVTRVALVFNPVTAPFAEQYVVRSCQRKPWRTATKLSGMYHPRGQIFFGMRLPLLLQRRKAKAAFAKIRSWRPERIVLSHGRCFESHDDEVIRRIFGAPAA